MADFVFLENGSDELCKEAMIVGGSAHSPLLAASQAISARHSANALEEIAETLTWIGMSLETIADAAKARGGSE